METRSQSERLDAMERDVQQIARTLEGIVRSMARVAEVLERQVETNKLQRNLVAGCYRRIQH